MIIAAVLAGAGCTSPQGTATPSPTPAPTATPAPTPTPTATPVPGNQTLERQYQYVERFNSGVDHYNSGIALMKDANNTAVAGDHVNASRIMLQAKDRMDAATEEFKAMKQYAGTPTETSFSEKWAEVAGYESMSAQNASEAFAEYANEKNRPQGSQNLVKYNYYVQQANHYGSLATESRRQADALQSTITFLVPTAQP